MSASEPSYDWPPPGHNLPPAGWHSDPAGSALLRWWDGGAWTTRTFRPWAIASPASSLQAPPEQPPARLALWLASPVVSSLLLVPLAAITALGWAATAVFLIVTAVTGWPVTSAGSVYTGTGFAVLSLLDAAVVIIALVIRAGQDATAPQGGTTRVAGQAARRSRRATLVSPAAIRAMRAAIRRIRDYAPLTSLPRPVGRLLAMATMFTSLAAAWLLAWPLTHGGSHRTDAAGSAAADQRLLVVRQTFWHRG